MLINISFVAEEKRFIYLRHALLSAYPMKLDSVTADVSRARDANPCCATLQRFLRAG